MCGACGAGSARTALHWSGPFLASVPARSAAAASLTRWTRATGWSGTVSGVAGGFQVATSSGRRSWAVDLGVVVQQLRAYGVRADRLLDDPGPGVVEGPPTWPGLRPYGAGSDLMEEPGGRLLAPDPRRRYRLPALLAGLAVAERTGTLGRLTIHLDLGGSAGIVVRTDDHGAVSCEAVPAPVADVVFRAGQQSAGDLVALLSPTVLATTG